MMAAFITEALTEDSEPCDVLLVTGMLDVKTCRTEKERTVIKQVLPVLFSWLWNSGGE